MILGGKPSHRVVDPRRRWCHPLTGGSRPLASVVHSRPVMADCWADGCTNSVCWCVGADRGMSRGHGPGHWMDVAHGLKNEGHRVPLVPELPCLDGATGWELMPVGWPLAAIQSHRTCHHACCDGSWTMKKTRSQSASRPCRAAEQLEGAGLAKSRCWWK